MTNACKKFFKFIIQYDYTIFCKFDVQQSCRAENGLRLAKDHFYID